MNHSPAFSIPLTPLQLDAILNGVFPLSLRNVLGLYHDKLKVFVSDPSMTLAFAIEMLDEESFMGVFAEAAAIYHEAVSECPY